MSNESKGSLQRFVVSLFLEYVKEFIAQGAQFNPCLDAFEQWEGKAFKSNRLTRFLTTLREEFRVHPHPAELQTRLTRKFSHILATSKTPEDHPHFDEVVLRRIVVALFINDLEKFAFGGPAYKPCLRDFESWERLALNDDRLTRFLRAVRAAFENHPDPDNLRWWLIREISHLRGLDDDEDDERPGSHDDNDDPGQGGGRCKKCGGPTKPGPKAAFLAKYPLGLDLDDLQDPLDYDRFLGLHLTEEDLAQLAGKEINFKRQHDIVFKHYHEDERDKRKKRRIKKHKK